MHCPTVNAISLPSASLKVCRSALSPVHLLMSELPLISANFSCAASSFHTRLSNPSRIGLYTSFSVVSPRLLKYRRASIMSSPSSCAVISPSRVSAVLPNSALRVFSWLAFTPCIWWMLLSATACTAFPRPSAIILLAFRILVFMLVRMSASCCVCRPFNLCRSMSPTSSISSLIIFGRSGSKSA